MNFSIPSLMHNTMYFPPQNSTTLPESLIEGPLQYPWYHVHRESVFPGISDSLASLLGNVIAYWVVSLSYHVLDISGWKWLEKYRIQESDEVTSRNLVTKGRVVREVAFQQFLQTTFGYIWLNSVSESVNFRNHAADLRQLSGTVSRFALPLLGEERAQLLLSAYGPRITYGLYWWAIPITQFIIALLILDTYQYFLHRMFHEVKFFYKHFHSVHHRLYVPYAFGALYGHPFEGAILDGLGATLAHTLAGLSDRQGILLFAFATYKTVDDHCGYYFPWHPIHMLFGNNAEYHDIHHQHAGIKSNYSQPLFIHWDVILGTRMTMEQLREKKGLSKKKHIKTA
ncbi:sphingosine hydroxylase [Hysterangium stoloniferum]|nr:sphingosine hydroxylase [Hysterangium stoloniferum]